MMHQWVHCCDEAANHQLPIATALWVFWIVSMEEWSSLMQTLDADSLFYLLSHFECEDHTAHMLTQWCLLPPVTSTVKSSSFMHTHSSPLSLVARLINVAQTILVTLIMTGNFPDRPQCSYTDHSWKKVICIFYIYIWKAYTEIIRDWRCDTTNNENRTKESHSLKGHVFLKYIIYPSNVHESRQGDLRPLKLILRLQKGMNRDNTSYTLWEPQYPTSNSVRIFPFNLKIVVWTSPPATNNTYKNIKIKIRSLQSMQKAFLRIVNDLQWDCIPAV